MTKQEKAEAKRSRRASRNHCGQVCRTDDCCGPGGFSEYGHWNASLKARAERAKRGAPVRVCKEGVRGCELTMHPPGAHINALSPRAARALAMVAALSGPPPRDGTGPALGDQ